ncbi:MAG: PhoU domain-containing protein [Nitriliruptoraceae bacterium]
MPFGFLRTDGSERLERIETTLQRMFVDDRHSFDVAMSALVGGASPGTVGEDLRNTDHRVNEAEREIRRELVVHAGVYGGIETPTILVYMSIVKDVERIGDYAKNLFDIAGDGVVLDAGDLMNEVVTLRSSISEMISEVAETFSQRDGDRSRALLEQGDAMLDDFDQRVSDLVTGRISGAHDVAYALTYRYFKRIVAHLMNVLSAVVMPVDRLDYFDEDPEDREERTSDA